jgi:hypothetical protein
MFAALFLLLLLLVKVRREDAGFFKLPRAGAGEPPAALSKFLAAWRGAAAAAGARILIVLLLQVLELLEMLQKLVARVSLTLMPSMVPQQSVEAVGALVALAGDASDFEVVVLARSASFCCCNEKFKRNAHCLKNLLCEE